MGRSKVVLPCSSQVEGRWPEKCESCLAVLERKPAFISQQEFSCQVVRLHERVANDIQKVAQKLEVKSLKRKGEFPPLSDGAAPKKVGKGSPTKVELVDDADEPAGASIVLIENGMAENALVLQPTEVDAWDDVLMIKSELARSGCVLFSDVFVFLNGFWISTRIKRVGQRLGRSNLKWL